MTAEGEAGAGFPLCRTLTGGSGSDWGRPRAGFQQASRTSTGLCTGRGAGYSLVCFQKGKDHVSTSWGQARRGPSIPSQRSSDTGTTSCCVGGQRLSKPPLKAAGERLRFLQ